MYKEFAKYFDRLEYKYRNYPKESKWISGLLEARDCKDVIDLSCGTGSHLALLRNDALNVNLVGIDASKEMVGLARKKLGEIPLLRADFLRVPFKKESFDAALCMYWSVAGLNSSLVKLLFEQAYSILKPGGVLFLDTENAEGIKDSLLNAPFIDGFFTDPDENLIVIRANFSTKIKPDLVDWRAYYLLESEGVSELQTDRMNLRFYSTEAIESLLKETGFKTIDVLSGPYAEYKKDSPTLYFVAEKNRAN